MIDDGASPGPRRSSRAYMATDGIPVPDGYDLYLLQGDAAPPGPGTNYVRLPPVLSHLGSGDVVSVSNDGHHVKVLWRRNARQNSVLLTERCDHYCLMCSQPPKQNNDDWLLGEAAELIRLLPRDTTDIGFTGGEPTLYGEGLVDLLRLCHNLLPDADVHTLSNGRRFADAEFAASYASIENERMMIGIPIYGAEPSRHDYVVQSKGAFDATIRGLLNLGALAQRIELRVVLHKQTAPFLAEIAEFIARNLPFVEHVALMGLEMTGFARANVEELWIDPFDYRDELVEAVDLLDRRGVTTVLFNHQLCLIDRSLWPYAVQSISDWKNEYHPECLACAVQHECGGFFHTAKYRMSDHIRAIAPDEAGSAPALLPVAS